jgi:thiol-disulfide isomerase/thioredoxin
MKMFTLMLFGVTLAFAPIVSAVEAPRNFVLHKSPKALPEIQLQGADGRARGLTDFRGKVVLLNIWATWCAPCRREMPTLDRLQATLGGEGFEVVALSIDRAGIDVVRKFYTEVGIKHLVLYIDSSGKAASKLSASGLPTTLLIDREGREVGRLVGPAEWDAPAMVAFIRDHLTERASSLQPILPALSPAHNFAHIPLDLESSLTANVTSPLQQPKELSHDRDKTV